MKILHTSDWHLGRSLYGRKRYDEFSAFLEWLADRIAEQHIDALLIAGDVFDTSTPSNRAQELYYRFLCKVAASCCRHIIIIAGNHDSPSFLNAPKALLRALNVHVVGATTENPEDQVIVLDNENNDPMAIVCAVPYLRDKDIRMAMPGETMDDKNARLIEGIRNHYADVCVIAERKRKEEGQLKEIPIIAMGHLFTAGGRTVEGDGVRELYVGSLAHVGKELFPSCIDYLALGHLHMPQCVGNVNHYRYSGSPIPMGYGEINQAKKVIVAEWDHSRTPAIREIPIPCFQPLVRIVGSLDEIQEKVMQLRQEESTAWLEIEYAGSDMIGNLRELVEESLNGTTMEIRRIKNRRIMDRISRIREDETLDDLDVHDVFERCLEASGVPSADRLEMKQLYQEIVRSLHEEDVNAE
jgi:exonuclease SbcD